MAAAPCWWTGPGVRLPGAGRRRWAPTSPRSRGSTPRARFTDVQQAFIGRGAVQCGFCTLGLVVAVHDLLARQPQPDELTVRESLAGNLCRCTGYGRIVEAVHTVAHRRAGVR
ncbi:MAG: 2Fe-2S iron-sulfur cluster-binding protein [Acidimicrobiales bacterium]